MTLEDIRQHAADMKHRETKRGQKRRRAAAKGWVDVARAYYEENKSHLPLLAKFHHTGYHPCMISKKQRRAGQKGKVVVMWTRPNEKGQTSEVAPSCIKFCD